MKIKKKTKVLFTSCLACILVFALASGVSAADGAKSISAIFKNIKLTKNGQTIKTEAEPFIYGGKTYVPLRVIADALGVYVDWNSNTNVVTVGGSTSSAATEDELYQKNIQIAQLQIQVEELQAQLAKASGSSSTTTSTTDDGKIDELEKDISDDYDKLGDVKIDDISLSGDEDKVTVTIKVDLGDYDDEWDDLSDSEIKAWVKDLCGDIQDFYSDDTDISGKIKDSDKNDTIVTFSKDGSDSVDVEIDDSSSGDGDKTLSEVESELDGDTYSVDGISFKIDDIDYKSSDIIEVSLKATEDGGDDLDFDDNNVEDDVISICKDIVDAFSEDAGYDAETVKIGFYDKDDSSLEDLEYDVNDKDLS